MDNNQIQINKINIEPCAGGCRMYYGDLTKGKGKSSYWFFACDSWDYSFITNVDLSDYIYDDNFYQMCIDNMETLLEESDHWEFFHQIESAVLQRNG